MEKRKNLNSIMRYFYSGGSENNDPNLSLGGEISNYFIDAEKESVFKNVSQDVYSQGLIDYRCIYLKNISNKRIHNFTISLSDVFKGAIFSFGFNFVNEIQTITLTGGKFTNNDYIIFGYKDKKFKVLFHNNPNKFAANFQKSINKFFNLKDVIVEGKGAKGTSVLDVFFNGDAGSKQHPLLTVLETNLSPKPEFYIVKKVTGSPINCYQDKLNNSEQEPFNIQFLEFSDMINIKLLEIGDFLPIWLRRNIFSGTIPIENDGCNIFTEALVEFKKDV